MVCPQLRCMAMDIGALSGEGLRKDGGRRANWNKRSSGRFRWPSWKSRGYRDPLSLGRSAQQIVRDDERIGWQSGRRIVLPYILFALSLEGS